MATTAPTPDPKTPAVPAAAQPVPAAAPVAAQTPAAAPAPEKAVPAAEAPKDAAKPEAAPAPSAPSAAERIAEARISGSPMLLVAAQIQADQDAADALSGADKLPPEIRALQSQARANETAALLKAAQDEAARAALPKVAAAATATAPAGVAFAGPTPLQPDQAPAPRPVALTAGVVVAAADAGEADEERVKMTFPRKLHLTLDSRAVVVFERGVNFVPVSIASHPYLAQAGGKLVDAPAQRVLEPIQTGTAEKTAPVK